MSPKAGAAGSEPEVVLYMRFMLPVQRGNLFASLRPSGVVGQRTRPTENQQTKSLVCQPGYYTDRQKQIPW